MKKEKQTKTTLKQKNKTTGDKKYNLLLTKDADCQVAIQF